MTRTVVIVIAQAVAAVLGLAGIYWSLLMQIMQSSIPVVDRARFFALIAIVLITGAVVTAAIKRWRVPAFAVVGALLLTLAAGVWPNVVYQIERRANAERNAAERRAELAAADAKALARIEARTRDVEGRLAENRPYAGQEALGFVDEVGYVDLKYLGLADRTDAMMTLLKRALAARLIDPNVPVKGPRPVDVKEEPLFVHYYRANINRYPSSTVRLRDWEVFKLLAASGADLKLAGDLPIEQDLRKEPKADQFGNHRLQ